MDGYKVLKLIVLWNSSIAASCRSLEHGLAIAKQAKKYTIYFDLMGSTDNLLWA